MKVSAESKDALDTTNSICWFLMDAFWMLGAPGLGLVLILPTLFTGFALLAIEKRRSVFWINVAINCWILMNSIWMVSDALKRPELMVFSRLTFALGVASIGASIAFSGSVRETFSHFRRFRALKRF